MILKPVAPVAPTPSLYSVTGMVAGIRTALFDLPDHRKGGNNQRYAIGGAESLFGVLHAEPFFLG